MRRRDDHTMTVKKTPDVDATAKPFTAPSSWHSVRNIPTFGGSASTRWIGSSPSRRRGWDSADSGSTRPRRIRSSPALPRVSAGPALPPRLPRAEQAQMACPSLGVNGVQVQWLRLPARRGRIGGGEQLRRQNSAFASPVWNTARRAPGHQSPTPTRTASRSSDGRTSQTSLASSCSTTLTAAPPAGIHANDHFSRMTLID